MVSPNAKREQDERALSRHHHPTTPVGNVINSSSSPTTCGESEPVGRVARRRLSTRRVLPLTPTVRVESADSTAGLQSASGDNDPFGAQRHEDRGLYSPYRPSCGRRLPALPETANIASVTTTTSTTSSSSSSGSSPLKETRKLSVQLLANKRSSRATDSASNTTRHLSMTDVFCQPLSKASDKAALRVPQAGNSLEALFRRCTVLSKANDEDDDYDGKSVGSAASPPLHRRNASIRSSKSVCLAPCARSPQSSPGRSAAKNGLAPAKRGSWSACTVERRPSNVGLGLLHFSIQYFPVRRRLRLLIAKAEDLAANLRADLQLNTFVKVHLSPGKMQKQKSHRLVKRSRDADTVYNEEFFFTDVGDDEVKACTVEIRLCHKTNRQLHADLVVGEVKVPLNTIRELGSKREILVVRSILPKQIVKRGRIHFGICLETEAQRLTVNVNKIDDLPHNEITGLPDPLVRLTLDQNGVVQTKQTRLLRNTRNPVFKEAVMFLISAKGEDLQNMSLTMSVLNGNGPVEEALGTLFLATLGAEKSCLEQWRQMIQHAGKEIKASHTLRCPDNA